MTAPDRSAKQAATLAVGADDAYARPMAVALHSALRHLDPARPVTVHVLDGGVSPRNMRRCVDSLAQVRPDARVEVVSPAGEAIEGLHLSGHFARAAYLRLLLPSLLPPQLDRVLYLDSDTVTMEDLGPLFDFDLDEKPVWAVRDMRQTHFERLRGVVPALDPPVGAPCFNSGVLLMGLRAWRAERVSERALDLIARHGPRMAYMDQDALNLVCAGRWGRLPDKWNNMVLDQEIAFPEAQDGGAGAGVYHFLGTTKPWTPAKDCARRDVYVAALRRSGLRSAAAIGAEEARRKAYQLYIRAPARPPVRMVASWLLSQFGL